MHFLEASIPALESALHGEGLLPVVFATIPQMLQKPCLASHRCSVITCLMSELCELGIVGGISPFDRGKG